MEREVKKKFKQVELSLDRLGKSINEHYERGRKEAIKEILPKLKKIRKILNKYHSEIPLVEIGRQNTLNDVDNEVDIDKLINKLSKELKQSA